VTRLGLSLTGFAALAVQVLAARLLGDLFGHDASTAAATLAAWMAASAAGALATARVDRPARLVFGAAATAVGMATLAMPPFAALFASPPHGATLRLAVCLALVGPAAFAAGAALPLALKGGRTAPGVAITWQAVGAATGAILAPLGLVTIGLHASLTTAAVVSAAGGAAFAWGPHVAKIPSTLDRPALPDAPLCAFALGFALVGVEALATRSLASSIGASLRSFSLVLATTVAGLALGATISDRFWRVSTRAWVGAAGALAITSGLLAALANRLLAASSGLAPDLLGAAMVALPFSVAAGAAFAAVVEAAPSAPVAVAAETAGGLGAGLLVLPVLVPTLGLPGSAIATGAACGLVARSPLWLAASVAAATALLSIPPTLRPGDLRIVESQVGPGATVDVVARSDGDVQLRIDERWGQGGVRGAFLERRQGHIPMLLHPDPRSVLVIGVGTGDTLGAVAMHARRVVGVEIVPEVLSVLGRFERTNGGVARRAGVTLRVGDGAAVVRGSEKFDVVLGDVVHPWVSGAAAIFSRDHHARVKARLRPGGIAASWLPLHQLSVRALRTAISSFQAVHPRARALLGSYNAKTPVLLLVGGMDLPGDAELLRRLGRAREAMRHEGLSTVDDVLGLYVLGPAELRALAAGSAPTTDDRPLLETLALGARRAGETKCASRTLHAVLEEGPPRDTPARLRARALAVRSFLEAQRAELVGETEAATMFYEHALEEDPTLTAARVALDRFRPLANQTARLAVRAFEGGRLDEAGALARSASAIHPSEPLTLEVQAMLAREDGRRDEAATLFERAVRAGAGVAAHRRLVAVLLELGRREDAHRALQSGLVHFPDDPLLRQLGAALGAP